MRSGLFGLLRKAATIAALSGLVTAGIAGLTASPAAAAASAAPGRPTGLTINAVACTAKPLIPVWDEYMTLAATFSDPDGDLVTPEFQWWPVQSPQQRTDITGVKGSSSTLLNPTTLTDKTTYAWRTRGSDGTNTGPWSGPCEFRTDMAAPNAPTVTSTDYPPSSTSGTATPAGGSGIPGKFTFDANGSTDVVGFNYGTSYPNEHYVAANHLGGSATIDLTPAVGGWNQLLVESVTQGQRQSAQTTYQFYVANNTPAVTCTPDDGLIGVPRQCAITPAEGQDASLGYVYQFDHGAVTPLPANPDGTASITVTPTNPTGNVLAVQMKLSNGNLTAPDTVFMKSESAPPTVRVSPDEVPVGIPVQVTFTAALPGSVSFTYTADSNNDQPITVPVGADGTATVTITPTIQGADEIDVYSTTASGLNSGTTKTGVFCDGDEPYVTSTQFPEYSMNNEPGVTGTFTFSSGTPGVTSYTYAFDGGAPVTVPAGPDGTASVTLTSTATNPQMLFVTSTLPDGSTSDRNQYTFSLDTRTPTVSCPQGQAGQPIQCTVQPGQSNVASYTYTFDSGPSTTVQAAPDGTATITLTAPDTAGTYYLDITSADTAGLSSDLEITAVDVVSGTS